MTHSPVIKKILIFGIASGLISMLLACIGFAGVEFHEIKNGSEAKLQSQIDMLSYNLQSSLLFDDKEAADKILLSLQPDHSINRVELYDANGKLFTSFVQRNQKGNIKFSKTIMYQHHPIGRLVMEADYLRVKDKYVAYTLICLLIILISIPISYWISAPIRKQVGQGVVQLELQSSRLRQLADQVASTEQKERKRIAALLHDHLQQILAASKLQIGLACKRMERQKFDEAMASLNRGEEFLNEALQAARSLTVELRPPVLYEDGLVAAFRWLAQKFKHEYDFDVVLDLEEVPGRLSDNLRIMVFESTKELLFNAVKYARVRRAELSLKYGPGFIMVGVKDEGKGFNVHDIERPLSDKGFGLFSIRERIKLINGEFTLMSKPGEGTQVRMVVPVEITTEQPQNVLISRGPEPEALHEDAIKILLADDHKIVREGIANLLKENPAFDVVAQADDGVDAVKKTEDFRPDVVVMDVNMPRLNGIEATRIIKNRFPRVDVIGLSVQNEEGIADSMKKAGALTLLNKAGDIQELVRTILICGRK